MASSRKSRCRGTACRAPTLNDRIAARLAPLIPAHSSILVGLSGGVDSVVLLHLLHQLAPRFSWQLSALHVHHGISPNADAWADFCAGLCVQHVIPLHIEYVDIAPLRAHGIEAAARKLRHAAFARHACDFVALAHHADDQAETLLLQLLRGSGVKGASAMPVLSKVERPILSKVEGPVLITSDLPTCGLSRMASSSISLSKWPPLAESVASISVLRPLLHCSRQEIIEYAAAYELRWIEDESNADDSYPRNFLRHRVLPLLGERFSACRDTLARSVQHFAEAGELLDDLARLDAAQAIHADTLAVTALQALGMPRAKNLLRYFLYSIGAPMPQTAQLNDMLQQLCNAREDAAVCTAYGDWQVRRHQGRVYVLHALEKFDPKLLLPWHGEAKLCWTALNAHLIFEHTQGQGISLLKLQSVPVTLRLRQGGETLRPHPNAAMRTLKNLLQEHHVPPWQRERLPLLYCGGDLVCVVGVAIAAEYQASSDEMALTVSLSR